jgi:hypothetical protein
MHSKIAIVIMYDIKKYFPNTLWTITKQDKDKFEAKNEEDMTVSIGPADVKYRVVMKSQDNPEYDKDEVVSSPLSYILKNMNGGSKDPSNKIYDELNKKRASLGEIARRIAARNSDADFRMEKRILDNLNKEAKGKGWDFELKNNEPPLLSSDDSGFNLQIFVDSISWGYSFKLEGYPVGDHSGKTSDPIQEFERWKRLDKLKEAVREYNDDVDDNADTKKPPSPTIR